MVYIEQTNSCIEAEIITNNFADGLSAICLGIGEPATGETPEGTGLTELGLLACSGSEILDILAKELRAGLEDDLGME